VFVPVINNPQELVSGIEKSEPGPTTGEIVALDAATGKVKWSEELGSAAFGATTVVNDLVFVTTYEGTVSAYTADSGQVVWREKLPAGSNSGVSIDGDTLVAPAGVASGAGQVAKIVAFRVGE